MKFILLTLGCLAMFGGTLFYFGSALIHRRRFSPEDIAAANAAGPGWRLLLFTWITVAGATAVTLARAFFVMLVALLFVCAAPAAYAATAATALGLDYGDFLAKVLALFAAAIASFVWYLIQKYVPQFYRLFLTQDVVTNAVNAALAEVEGAVAGQQLPIATVNSVILAAVAWANANEPAALAFIKKDIQPLIVAKLSGAGIIPATASSATLVSG